MQRMLTLSRLVVLLGAPLVAFTLASFREGDEIAFAFANPNGDVAAGEFEGPVNCDGTYFPADRPGAPPSGVPEGQDAAVPVPVVPATPSDEADEPDSRGQPPAGTTPDVPPTDLADLPSGTGSVQRFLEVALAQEGDQYAQTVGGQPVEASYSDPDPDVFDSSELVEWAAAQAGVPNVGESSYDQYLQMEAAGTVIPVEDAVNIPGALLFRFPHEPIPGEGRQPGSHVAISLGNGETIEATSPSTGVHRGTVTPDRDFEFAALIPGLNYGEITPGLDYREITPLDSSPSTTSSLAQWEPVECAGAIDSDRDGLPDSFEVGHGLQPGQPDSDGDGLTDGYELIVLGTTANRADTDFDQMSDGIEMLLDSDPLVADRPNLVPDEPAMPPLEPAPTEFVTLEAEFFGLWAEEQGQELAAVACTTELVLTCYGTTADGSAFGAVWMGPGGWTVLSSRGTDVESVAPGG